MALSFGPVERVVLVSGPALSVATAVITTGLALLDQGVVARRAHGFEVRRVEEERLVTLVRRDVVRDRGAGRATVIEANPTKRFCGELRSA